MAHSMLITALETAARDARSAGNAMLFLNRLESNHTNWHNRSLSARGLGFLIYHWYVIKSFRQARAANLWTGGIRPFRPVDFANFGWPYDVSASAHSGDFASLADFSIAIETWHNDAHMAVGVAFGIADEMMNPSINIYHREFWRLHYFINNRFLTEIRRFDSAGSVAQKVQRLETSHHGDLYRV